MHQASATPFLVKSDTVMVAVCQLVIDLNWKMVPKIGYCNKKNKDWMECYDYPALQVRPTFWLRCSQEPCGYCCYSIADLIKRLYYLAVS